MMKELIFLFLFFVICAFAYLSIRIVVERNMEYGIREIFRTVMKKWQFITLVEQ